jgi:phenylalanyl-tRNA synthetase beta chain
MKISYNWLSQFVQTHTSPEETSKILTNIGLEVESLERHLAVPGGLEGLVVGKVLQCVPHPNADRLRVTQVDVGQEEPLQIVCGAPNVAEGQKVIVALVGTTVYPTEGEAFKINKSKIRGVESHGMICAEDEIGLGQSHEGILVLPEDAPIGQEAAAYFGLEADHVFEIGLTPNRADAASHLGVARDLAAHARMPFTLPSLATIDALIPQKDSPVSVIVEDEGACPRYASLLIQNIQVGESPDWLKTKLLAIGVRPINNIVDATNYVLHALGQPLHAFDAAKIAGQQVVVRRARAGEQFITLDGIERNLHVDDLLICDQQKPMCIAGVFGGLHSGVTETTTQVFLESAYFDPVAVRKAAKRHGLKTDASFRFERGVDPNATVFALKYAAQLILDIAGGEVVSSVQDHYPQPLQPFTFTVRYARVQQLIGQAIPHEEIKAIILALGIEVLSSSDDALEVAVPPFKVDVTREVDVIEEVLRLYGYNNVALKSQVNASLNTTAKPDKEVILHQIAELLTANGYREILSNSLNSLNEAEQAEQAVRIVNPLSSDLDTMRQQMVYSSLHAIAYNQKRKHTDLKFYEFGHTYRQVEDKFVEQMHLHISLAGKWDAPHWLAKDQTVGFVHIKGIVDVILQRLGIKGVNIEEFESPSVQWGLQYVKNTHVLVQFGKVSKAACKLADVNGDIFVADFHWDVLMKLLKNNKIKYQEVAKFPSVKRDLSLLVDDAVSFDALKRIAERTEKKLLKEVGVFDVYKGDKLPAGKKSYALSFVIQDEEKTLSDKQIDAVIQKLIYNFEKETGAEIRK